MNQDPYYTEQWNEGGDEEQEDDEEEEYEDDEEEEPVPDNKAKFQDLMKQYDDMLTSKIEVLMPELRLEQNKESESEEDEEEEEEVDEEDTENADEEPATAAIQDDSFSFREWIRDYQTPIVIKQRCAVAYKLPLPPPKEGEPALVQDAERPSHLAVERQLLALVNSIEGKDASPSASLFQLFYNWLQSYTESNSEDRRQHVDMFNIYFNILFNTKTEGADAKPALDRRTQLEGFSVTTATDELARLSQFLLKNRPARVYCRQTGWPIGCMEIIRRIKLKQPSAQLMGELMDSLVHLLLILLMDGITVLELKTVFRTMLHVSRNPLKTNASHKLLAVVHRLLQYHRGPSEYWEFNAGCQESGLLLPEIQNWPGGGYTICSWVWIDSFVDPAAKALGYTPYIFSFLGEKGQGIELYFHNEHSLVIKVSSAGKGSNAVQKVTLRPSGDFKFQTKTWYFLALTHSSHFIRSTEVILYVNGKKVATCSVNYPKFDESLSLCTLATQVVGSSSSKKKKAMDTSQYSSVHLHGRMTAFLLFDLAMNDEQIAYIFRSRYQNHFLAQITFNTELANHVLVGYCPQAKWGKNSFMELSLPIKTGEFEQNYNKHRQAGFHTRALNNQFRTNAQGTVGTSAVMNGMPIKQAFNSMLQLSPIFLIFSMLKRVCGKSNTSVDKLAKSDFLLGSLNLMTSMIQDDPAGTRELHRRDAFVLLGRVLFERHVLPELWELQNHACVEALYKLGSAAQPNVDLWHQMIKHVYLNFNIWIQCSSATQHAVLSMLTTVLMQNPYTFKRLLGTQGILDVLRNYYWFNDEYRQKELSLEGEGLQQQQEGVAVAEETSSSNALAALRRRKLPAEEVKELRKKLLHWLEVLVLTLGEDPKETDTNNKRSKRQRPKKREGGAPVGTAEGSPKTPSRNKNREKPKEREKKAETMREIERDTDFQYERTAVLKGVQKDMRAIFLYLQDIAGKDAYQMKDVLRLLFTFLLKDNAHYDSIFSGQQQPQQQQRIFFGENMLRVTGKAGINAFIGLLGFCTGDENLRLWVLRVIAKLVECKKKQKVRSSFSPLPLSAIRSTVDQPLLSAMKFYLQTNAVTVNTYFSLMSLMLGEEVSLDFGTTSPISGDSLSPSSLKSGDLLNSESPFLDSSLMKEEEDRKFLLQENTKSGGVSVGVVGAGEGLNLTKAKIKYPGFIPIIFELICSSKNSELHTLLLGDFLRLLQQSAENREIFLQGANSKKKAKPASWQWKAWLFGLLANNAKDPSVLSMVIDFFVTLLHHGMLMASSSSSSSTSGPLTTPRKTNSLSVESFEEEVTAGEEKEKKKEKAKAQGGEGEDGQQQQEAKLPFGIRNLLETQTLIKYFGETGFFDTVSFSKQLHSRMLLPIINSIKTCAPPLPPSPTAAGTNAHLIQKLENWLGWFELVEEYLFYSPRMPLTPEASMDPFLAGLHRNLQGVWDDLSFAMEVTDAMDQLKDKIDTWLRTISTSNPIFPSLSEIQRRLDGMNDDMGLRIALTTLHEADSYYITEAETLSAGGLERMESLVREGIAAVPGLTSQAQHTILTSTSDYLAQKRMAFWQRSNEGQKVYQKCIDRIAWLFVGSQGQENISVSILKRYFVIGFLYRAMKHSHETSGGKGAKIIIDLFKQLCTDLKHRCVHLTLPNPSEFPEGECPFSYEELEIITQSQEELSRIPEEELMAYFFKGFASTSQQAFSLVRPVGEAIKREQYAIQQKAENVNQRNLNGRAKIQEEMQNKVEMEAELQNQFQASLAAHQGVWLDLELKRRYISHPWGHRREWLEAKWNAIWAICSSEIAPCYLPPAQSAVTAHEQQQEKPHTAMFDLLKEAGKEGDGGVSAINKISWLSSTDKRHTANSLYSPQREDKTIQVPQSELTKGERQQDNNNNNNTNNEDDDITAIRCIFPFKQKKQLIIVHNNAIITLHSYRVEGVAASSDPKTPRGGSSSSGKRPPQPPSMGGTLFIEPDANFAAKNSPKYFPNLLVANSLNSSPTTLSFVDSRKCFAFLPSLFNEKLLYVIHGGLFDSTLALMSIEESGTKATLGSVDTPHDGTVTAVNVTADMVTLVTGSKDTTIAIWGIQDVDNRQGLISSIFAASKIEPPKLTLRHMLYGHNAEIVCLETDVMLHLLVSSSSDGDVLLHDLRNGAFISSLNYHRTESGAIGGGSVDNHTSQTPEEARVIAYLKILSSRKQIISYCRHTRILYLHSLETGKLVAWKKLDWLERIDCWLVTRDGKYLIGGGKEGSVVLLSVDADRFFVEDQTKILGGTAGGREVTSLALVEERNTEYLLVGLSNGLLKVYPFRP